MEKGSIEKWLFGCVMAVKEQVTVLIESEAVFAMKDVCIMEYHCTWAIIIFASIKDWKQIELACTLGRNLDCDKWGLDSMG